MAWLLRAFPERVAVWSKAQLSQPRVIIRATAQRPMELAVFRLDGPVIDARVAMRHQALRIELHEVLHDTVVELGEDPGLVKDGVEAELQELLAARVAALRDDLTLPFRTGYVRLRAEETQRIVR